MRKLRAGALLGGLTLVAVLLLAGLVRAQLIGPFSKQSLQTLKKLCADAIKEAPKDTEDSDLAVGYSCLALVDVLGKVTVFDLGESGPSDAVLNLAAPLAKASLKFFKSADADKKDTCDACVQSVQDFESALATNGTAAGIRQALTDACFDEFQDPADQAACVATASDIPKLIDVLLGNLPPLTTCQEANYCPR